MIEKQLTFTIDALTERRAEIDGMLSQAIALRDALAQLASKDPGIQRIFDEPNGDKGHKAVKRTTVSKKLPIWAAAMKVLKKSGPAKTGMILRMLAESGYKVGGKKPVVTLYSALTRSPKLIRVKTGEWGIKGSRT